MVELVSKWNTATAILTNKLGRPPIKAEITEELGFTKENIDAIIRAIRTSTMATQSLSIEGSRGISEYIKDSNAKKPEDEILNDQEVIDERDSKVLKMRFGIGFDEPMTLKEISEKLSLTRERIRQIQNETLKKLYQFMNKGVTAETIGLLKKKKKKKAKKKDNQAVRRKNKN